MSKNIKFGSDSSVMLDIVTWHLLYGLL